MENSPNCYERLTMAITMSKSTDKLMIINDMLERLPVNKIKTITISWVELEDIPVPNVLVEMFETAEDKVDETDPD